MRALGITVTQTMRCTSVRVLALATISVHLHKIQGTIQSTSQFGIIDSVGELLVLQLEELVSIVILHQVRTRANVLAVRTLSHETKLQFVARGLHTVRVGVLLVGSLDHALRS